jgi:hypothetical protein
MTLPKPDDVFGIPSADFLPLRLCLEDALPVSMVLLLGYRYRLEPADLRVALGAALRAFPHLGGRLHLEMDPLRAELVPDGREVKLEWVREGPGLPDSPGATEPGAEDGSARLRGLEALDQETLCRRFAPSAAGAARTPMQIFQAPLLQARLTWLAGSEACILGILASHMALDGSGLALFLEHAAASRRGGNAPAVIHDRGCTFSVPPPRKAGLPAHYVEVPQLSLALAQDQDPLAAAPATTFSIPLADAARRFGLATAAEARLFLAGRLCQDASRLQPGRATVALWCNARGLGGVPRNYTGNAGCYLHFPIEPGNHLSIFQQLKGLATRAGLAETADVYARLKAAEAAGRIVLWNGPGDSLLSLNLVRHVRGAADFGRGGPELGLLMTRNVSGLRLFHSPDGSALITEACLPAGQGAELRAACERSGLPVRSWHGSGPSLEGP